MSVHKKLDRQAFDGARIRVPQRNGAEWLVGMGFRCWLAGYDTGNIACWENGWNEYARALGPERARRAVTRTTNCAPGQVGVSGSSSSTAAPASPACGDCGVGQMCGAGSDCTTVYAEYLEVIGTRS